jgi:hypothetical protein
LPISSPAEELSSPWLLSSELALSLSEGLLSDDWLSDELLWGELWLEEEDGGGGGALEGVEGGEVGGGVGGCGVVGLLALGQPLSNMQAASRPANFGSDMCWM